MPVDVESKIEFIVLDGKTAREVDPHKVEWPDSSLVTYAHRNGKIIGRLALLEFPHLEGPWVDEAERGTTIFAQMVDGAEKTLKHCGKTHAFAFLDETSAEMKGYAERLGYKRKPIEVWVKEL